MAIELVVFDMAGTTVNDQGGAVNDCFRAALIDHGVSATPEAVNAVMGLAKSEAIGILLEKPAIDDLVEAIHRDFVARMIHHYTTDPSVREVDGISALFAELKRHGIKLAFNTGFSRAVTDPLLLKMGWAERGLVDAGITSDEVSRGRPHPFMIQELMRRLSIANAASVAKVGDASADLEEGANAGCSLNIGVTWGTHTREELAPYPHTHMVDSVADLSALLLGSALILRLTSTVNRVT